MLRMSAVAFAAAALASVPAAAQVYDPAVQGPNAANFVYGYDAGSGFTAFNFATDYQTSGCAISGTSCYQGPASFLGVYFAPADGQYQTAFLYDEDITFHPGPGSETAGLRFIAPTAGTYTFNGFVRAVDAASGNGVQVTTADGVTTFLAPGTTNPFSFNLTLGAGAFAQFSVANNGSYGFDTTGLNLQVSSAVPEPATWALMIGGVGMVGGALRRRKVQTKIRFA